MKTAKILVGVPASGKTTWTQANMNENTILISTDGHIDAYAKSVGKTYSEVFDEYINEATSHMMDDLRYAIANGFDIIWDQTNINAKSRKKKLKFLNDYEKIAIVFEIPEDKELNRRLTSRAGKFIPYSAMQSMISNFTVPTLEEGFNKIVFA